MVGKSELKFKGPRLFTSRGEHEFALKFWYYEPPIENQCEEKQKDELLWSALTINGRVARWKGGRVERWQGEKGGGVMRWEGGRFLGLFKGRHTGESKISFFASGNEEPW